METYDGENLDGVRKRTNPAGIEGLQVEDFDAVEVTKNLYTVKTSGLSFVRRDISGLRALTEDWRRGGMVVVRAADGADGERTDGGADGSPEGACGEGSGTCNAESGVEHGFLGREHGGGRWVGSRGCDGVGQ